MANWGIIIGSVAASFAFIAICLVLPRHLLKGRQFPDAEYEAADNTRKTLAQIFGGAAIILTFAWTFLKDSESLKQAWQQISNQEFIASSELLSDANSVATRAAGIYALGHVAASRIEYHMSVRDTLIAYISNKSASETIATGGRLNRINADVQAVIEVLGRRDLSNDDSNRSLSLDNQYLIGANFFNLKGFQNASFYGTKLSGTNFRDAKLDNAHFDGANFSDYIGYGWKNWDDKIVNRSDWENWEKYIYIANFEGASLENVTFTGAELAGAKFSRANLSGVNFARANLSRVDFRNSINIELAKFEDPTGKACADEPPKFDNKFSKKLIPCKQG